MMRAAWLALVMLAGCSMGPSPQAPGRCELTDAPVVMQASGDPHGPDGKLLQVWTVADDPVLWSEASPVSGGYADFRAKVTASGVETDPVKLLKAASPMKNNAVVLEHARAWIHPAGCLEKLLVGLQHERIDTFKAPTEFASIVTRSPDGTRLKIYFYTVNQDGIGRASPFTEPATADVAQGWTMKLALHPHAFHPGDAMLNGPVAPSVPDAGLAFNLHESAGLQASWITNGVSTVRIPASAFGEFERE